MRQFVRFLIVLITIAVLVGTTYYLVQYNKEYIEKNPISSSENKNEVNNKKEKSEVKLESKEEIEKNAQEEKDNLINTIKSTINMNILANARKTLNREIQKSIFGKIAIKESGDELISGEISGEQKTDELPDLISCTIQIAGSMINIVPDDNRLDSFEYHYRGDNKLVAYVRKFAGTSIKATYFFDNAELLDKEVNSFDTKYNEPEDASSILQRADILYNSFLKED